MKKVVTLVLAIALLLSSVVAIAETHATPNINTFATMKVKYDEANRIYTITLSKPVDRLLVKWAEKGAEPEELAVSEDLTATAIAWGHKYMPGVTQKYVTNVNAKDQNGVKYFKKTDEKVVKSEDLYNHGELTAFAYANKEYFDADKYVAKRMEDFNKANPSATAKQKAAAKKNYEDYAAYYANRYDEIIEEIKFDNDDKTVEVTAPKLVYEKDEYGDVVIDEYGFPVLKHEKDGSVKVYTPAKYTANKKASTVTANPGQAAFLTVQGDWAVSYNRAGKIVKIEYFDGQF